MAFAFRVQAVPLGYDGVSFQVDGLELTCYNNTGRGVWRPYLFPLVGLSGRMLTRMGHPHDPVGHRHHYSVWLAHHNVNGLDFWSDNEDNKQDHIACIELGDGLQTARLVCEIVWTSGVERPLLNERREMAVTYPEAFPVPGSASLQNAYWVLDITSQLKPATEPVTLDVTPFGLLGVRVAKSIGVRDGGGRIQNSNGQVNEREAFAQPARWCDYSGWVSEGIWEGIAVFDAPQNFGHPAEWHVRDDGWMCPSQFRRRALSLRIGESATFRHRLFVHGIDFDSSAIEEQYCLWVEELQRKVSAPET